MFVAEIDIEYTRGVVLHVITLIRKHYFIFICNFDTSNFGHERGMRGKRLMQFITSIYHNEA